MSRRLNRNSIKINPPLRVALLDDDARLHHAVHNYFTRSDVGWHLDACTNVANALPSIYADPPNVVLLERVSQGKCGIECTRKLKTRLPDLPVLMFTGRPDARMLLNVMIAGACGFLVKPLKPFALLLHLHKALAGGTPFCPRAERLLREGLQGFSQGNAALSLSHREQELMRCLCRHRTNKATAHVLGISEATVHAHLAKVFVTVQVISTDRKNSCLALSVQQ